MMNKITINGYELPIKDYNEQRVVTFKDIDLVHGRPEGTARKRFNDNKIHFIEGEDYFKTKLDEVRPFFGQTLPNGFNPKADIILITESGYLMLVKSFTDDLAWSVQRQLVNSYFRLKKQTEFSPLNAETLEIEEMNARTRMSSQLLKLAKTKAIPKPYRDKLLEKSVEVLTGEKLTINELEKPSQAETDVLNVLSEQSQSEEGYTVEMRYMTVTEFITHNISLRKYDTRTVGKVLEKYGYNQKRARVKGIPKAVRRLPYKIKIY